MSIPTGSQGAPGVTPEPRQLGTQRTELGQGWVSGNVTQEIQFRYTQNGRAVANVRIAYSPRIKDPMTGQWTEAETQFYDLAVWGQMGERCANLLSIGDRIVAGGMFYRETWEDKDGNLREAIKMTVTEIGASMLFSDLRILRRRSNGGNRQRNSQAPDLPPPPDEPSY